MKVGVTPTTAEWGLGGSRNHVCLVHDSSAERMRVLEDEVVDAFARGKRVIVLAESSTDPNLAAVLARTGDGARPGQLDVRNAADAYRAPGAFEPNAMLTALDDDRRQALADGFTGVHFLADMAWAAGDAKTLANLCTYERAANDVFADGTATAVCQYDRARFDAGTLTACTSAHDLLLSAFDGDETIGDDRASFDIGPHGTVRARGEIDMANAHVLEQALATAARRTGEDVCFDASQLSFVDVRGLHALLEAARTQTLTLLAPSQALRTMLRAVDAQRQMPSLRVG
jgi:anti-anti-sigma factor